MKHLRPKVKFWIVIIVVALILYITFAYLAGVMWSTHNRSHFNWAGTVLIILLGILFLVASGIWLLLRPSDTSADYSDFYRKFFGWVSVGAAVFLVFVVCSMSVVSSVTKVTGNFGLGKLAVLGLVISVIVIIGGGIYSSR